MSIDSTHPKTLALAVLLSALILSGCRHGAGAADPTPSGRVTLQLLAINDFHGQLEPPQGHGADVVIGHEPDGRPRLAVTGGLEHLAGLIEHLRAQHPHTLLVSAGDLVGASPLSSALFHDEPTIEAMNRLGLAMNAVGNHEFDDGVEELLRLKQGGCGPAHSCALGPFAGASFPFLAGNVFKADGSPLFPASLVREVDGVKVGFIGVTLEGTPAIVERKRVAGLTFVAEVEAVNAEVARLRARGVEALVLLVHQGAEHEGAIDGCDHVEGPVLGLAKAVDPSIDAVISGHSHAAYNCLIDGRSVTSALSGGRVVTRLMLELDRRSGDVVSLEAKNLPVLRDRTHPEMRALVEAYVQKVAPLEHEVIGRLSHPLVAPRHGTSAAGESTLGNVVADAFLAATEAEGAQLAFVNPGGLRADLPAGDVTYGDAFAASPFGNSLVMMNLTGAQILEALEQQWQPKKQRILGASAGLRYVWREGAPGAHVVPGSVTLHGVPLEPSRTYRVTVNSFLSTGGDGFSAFTRGSELGGGPQDLDALVQYLRSNSPLPRAQLGRIRRDEAPRTARGVPPPDTHRH